MKERKQLLITHYSESVNLHYITENLASVFIDTNRIKIKSYDVCAKLLMCREVIWLCYFTLTSMNEEDLESRLILYK